jgi:hypothetical protein
MRSVNAVLAECLICFLFCVAFVWPPYTCRQNPWFNIAALYGGRH